jgi:uncharacterized protein YqeY
MTQIQTQIEEDLKQALRDKNTNKLSVLRGLKAAFQNAAIAKGNALVEDDVLSIVRKQIASRKDSVEKFVDGKRFDLVAKEESELEVLKDYLPAEISDDDLAAVVILAIGEYETPSKKDMGNIISKVYEAINGRTDRKRIASIVSSKL